MPRTFRCSSYGRQYLDRVLTRDRGFQGTRDGHVSRLRIRVSDLGGRMATLWPGARVTLVLDPPPEPVDAIEDLLVRGVEAAPPELEAWLEERRCFYDAVVLFPGGSLSRSAAAVRRTQPQTFLVGPAGSLDGSAPPDVLCASRREEELARASAPGAEHLPLDDVERELPHLLVEAGSRPNALGDSQPCRAPTSAATPEVRPRNPVLVPLDRLGSGVVTPGAKPLEAMHAPHRPGTAFGGQSRQ